MGVVDVQLDRMEEVLHAALLSDRAVDHVLVPPANHHLRDTQRKLLRLAAQPSWCQGTVADLAGDGELRVLIVSVRRHRRVSVVEDQRDACLGHPGLALLVDELVEAPRTHLPRQPGGDTRSRTRR